MGTFIMQQGHKVDIGGEVANYTNVCVCTKCESQFLRARSVYYTSV